LAGLVLPTFTFVLFFSSKKQACGPEGRALRAKSIGGKRNPAGDPIGFPQNEAGPPGVSQFGIRNVEFGILGFFFPFRIPHSTFRILIARPTQRMNAASWFLCATPLLPGRAMLEIQ